MGTRLTYSSGMLQSFSPTLKSKLSTKLYQTLRTLHLINKPKTHRGTRGGIKAHRNIRVWITNSNFKPSSQNLIKREPNVINIVTNDIIDIPANTGSIGEACTVWNVVPSFGDGHCFIHSVVSSNDLQGTWRYPLTLHTLKLRFFTETVTNCDTYLPFVDGNNTLSLF